MDSLKLCQSDLHLHTNLSCCAPETTFAESYLPYCDSEGIKTLGFSNHLYTWRKLEETLKIRDEIEKIKANSDLKILVGCEAETVFGAEPDLDPRDSSLFDYVLLAPSHILNIRKRYNHIDLDDIDTYRELLVENFKAACRLQYKVPTGIAHPLYPICHKAQQEVLDGISDEQLVECFTLAAQNDKSIEIHACIYRGTVELDQDGLSPTYIKFLKIAKQCGCKFHFGSDAHKPETFIGSHAKLERAARRAGITQNDLWSIAK